MAEPPDRRFLTLVGAAGAAGFGLAAWLLDALAHAGLYGSLDGVLWVRPFWLDARLALEGDTPYRMFPLEYPPLSLPAFVLPALPPDGLTYASYRGWFELEMTALGMLLVAVAAWTVVRLGGSRRDVLLATAIVALSPLLAGPVVLARYDLWPALLVALATAAMLAGRARLAFLLTGLGILAKVYPGVLLPVFLIHAWRTSGRREAAIGMGIVVAAVALGLAPFVVAASGGVLEPFTRALDRPLQAETLGASLLALLHDVAGLPLDPTTESFGSANVGGPLAAVASMAQSAILAACLGAIWLAMAWGPPTRRALAGAAAATIVAVVAFGKVLSPQYVIWIIAPVVVLSPIRDRRILAELVAVLVLTTVFFPALYGGYVDRFDLPATAVLVVRDLALALLAAELIVSGGTVGVLRARWAGRTARAAPGPA